MTESIDHDAIALWRPPWLRLISELSDMSLQKERWLDAVRYPSPYWSFVEFFCMYYYDMGLEDGYERFVASGHVSPAEATAMQDLHAGLLGYKPPNGDGYDHAAILADPKWGSVVSLAAEAHQRLQELQRAGSDL